MKEIVFSVDPNAVAAERFICIITDENASSTVLKASTFNALVRKLDLEVAVEGS